MALDVSYNHIRNINKINSFLLPMNKLKMLTLKGNPIQLLRFYKEFFISEMQNLEYFDLEKIKKDDEDEKFYVVQDFGELMKMQYGEDYEEQVEDGKQAEKKNKGGKKGNNKDNKKDNKKDNNKGKDKDKKNNNRDNKKDNNNKGKDFKDNNKNFKDNNKGKDFKDNNKNFKDNKSKDSKNKEKTGEGTFEQDLASSHLSNRLRGGLSKSINFMEKFGVGGGSKEEFDLMVKIRVESFEGFRTVVLEGLREIGESGEVEGDLDEVMSSYWVEFEFSKFFVFRNCLFVVDGFFFYIYLFILF